MDGLVFMILTLVLTVLSLNKKEEVNTNALSTEIQESDCSELSKENVERVSKLNDSFYEDPNAFSRIINMLGFPKE